MNPLPPAHDQPNLKRPRSACDGATGEREATKRSKRSTPDDVVRKAKSFEKVLRISVLRISRKNSASVPHSATPDATAGRCRATMSIYYSCEEKKAHDKSSAGKYTELVRDAQVCELVRAGSGAYLTLDTPFTFSMEALMTKTPLPIKGASAPNEVSVWGFAPNYLLKVELEPLNAQSWPPVDIGGAQGFQDEIVQALRRGSMQNDITLSAQTPDIFDFSASPMPLGLSLTMRLEKAKQLIPYEIYIERAWAVPPRLETPGRPLVPSDCTTPLNYAFDQHKNSTVIGFTCTFCLQKFPMDNDLLMHLKTSHNHFEYEIVNPHSSGTGYTIKISLRGVGLSDVASPSMPKLHAEPEKPRPIQLPPRISRKPQPEYQNKSPTRKQALPQEKAITVPHDKGPFHDVFRQVIPPGSTFDPSAHEPDEEWLIKNHCDVIHDFTDITDAEKEYICQFDSFILREKIQENKLLRPAAVRRFVSENLEWFAEKDQRIIECGRHLTVLGMVGDIDRECFKDCAKLMRTLKAKRRHNDPFDHEDAMNID